MGVPPKVGVGVRPTSELRSTTANLPVLKPLARPARPNLWLPLSLSQFPLGIFTRTESGLDCSRIPHRAVPNVWHCSPPFRPAVPDLQACVALRWGPRRQSPGDRLLRRRPPTRRRDNPHGPRGCLHPVCLPVSRAPRSDTRALHTPKAQTLVEGKSGKHGRG